MRQAFFKSPPPIFPLNFVAAKEFCLLPSETPDTSQEYEGTVVRWTAECISQDILGFAAQSDRNSQWLKEDLFLTHIILLWVGCHSAPR